MVSLEAKPLRERLGVVPAFLGLALLGLFALWLALSSLIPSMRAIATHAPLVALSPHDAIGLPLALLFYALATTTLLPQPEAGPRRSRRKASKPGVDWVLVCLGVAVAGVLLTVAIVPITEVAALVLMERRHYVACPPPAHERHAPMRWALRPEQCP